MGEAALTRPSDTDELVRSLLLLRLRAREGDEPPYRRVRRLLQWAGERRSLLDGRIILQGGQPQALTLHAYLDAAYALVVEEFVLGRQGVPHGEVIETLEEKLDEVLPDELTAEQIELARRKRIALENEQARGRMAGFMEMERTR